MADAHEDGGPAFPTPRNEFGENSPSMSLRDWFAGQALACLAHPKNENGGYLKLAKDAYAMADVMLYERDTNKGP